MVHSVLRGAGESTKFIAVAEHGVFAWCRQVPAGEETGEQAGIFQGTRGKTSERSRQAFTRRSHHVPCCPPDDSRQVLDPGSAALLLCRGRTKNVSIREIRLPGVSMLHSRNSQNTVSLVGEFSTFCVRLFASSLVEPFERGAKYLTLPN